jgi:hypothetical protein
MRAFDKWVLRGPFTAEDVGAYRVVFGLTALLLLPNAQFLAAYPASFFDPPPGPFQLFSALPPMFVLVALELALAFSLAFLVMGIATRYASIVAGVLLIVIFGFTYSFGKIDHTIFLPLVALLVVWTGWGSRYSIDGLSSPRVDKPVAQWPLRLLAVLIGVGFATAAIPKFLGGWLRPGTQATQGHYWYELLIDERTVGFAPLFGQIHTPVFWEPLDWLTILLEGGLIIAAVSWRSFRIMIAFAAVFHLGVLVMMNILFTTNVIAYAAFVPWGVAIAWMRKRGVRAPDWNPRTKRRLAWAAVPVIAVAAWALSVTLPIEVEDGIKFVIIIIGGIVGGGYLLVEVVRLSRWIRRAGHPRRSGASRRDAASLT